VTPQIVTFLCGFGGSVAVEIVLLNQFMQTDSALPERYKKPAFWVVRILLAIVGGGLALAYEIDKPLLAANIGAATPLIIKAFSEGIRPTVGNVPDNASTVTATSKDTARQ
jgi:hypothetical protein